MMVRTVDADDGNASFEFDGAENIGTPFELPEASAVTVRHIS